jgi:hypothetical protein
LRCSIECAEELLGFQTVIGAGLSVAGQPFLPTRGKFRGATLGTSPASVAARNVFGDARSPVPLPAPTRNAPFATTYRYGVAAGRAAPLIGYVIIFSDARSLDYCVASCLRPPVN